MVSTAVLLTAILASYALIAGAFYALTAQLGVRIDQQGAHLGARLDRVDNRIEKLDDNVSGLRAAVAGIDSRLSTLEQRG